MSSIGEKQWQFICGILSTILLTGLGSYAVLGRDAVTRSEVQSMIPQNIVTRSEVSAMIRTESPYIPDQAMLKAEFKNIKDQLAELNRKIDNLSK